MRVRVPIRRRLLEGERRRHGPIGANSARPGAARDGIEAVLRRAGGARTGAEAGQITSVERLPEGGQGCRELRGGRIGLRASPGATRRGLRAACGGSGHARDATSDYVSSIEAGHAGGKRTTAAVRLPSPPPRGVATGSGLTGTPRCREPGSPPRRSDAHTSTGAPRGGSRA